MLEVIWICYILCAGLIDAIRARIRLRPASLFEPSNHSFGCWIGSIFVTLDICMSSNSLERSANPPMANSYSLARIARDFDTSENWNFKSAVVVLICISNQGM